MARNILAPKPKPRLFCPRGSGDGAKLESATRIIKDFVAEPYPLVNYTEEQMDEISKLTVDIYKYVNESWANWIVNGGIENDWDGYIAQLNQMGLRAPDGNLSGKLSILPTAPADELRVQLHLL